MPAHHVEVERKYEVLSGVQAQPDFSRLAGFSVGTPEQYELDATYYDTENQDLSRVRVAVRRRYGGHDEGWHIKFDDAQGNRHEVSFDSLDNREQIPEALTRCLQSVTSGRALVPAVSLATTRVRTVLSDAKGQPVAEICDDRVRAHDYRTDITRQWQEWEVELLDAEHELAEKAFAEVEHVLYASGAVASQSSAKIARAMGHDREFEQRRLGRNYLEPVDEKPQVKATYLPDCLVQEILESFEQVTSEGIKSFCE